MDIHNSIYGYPQFDWWISIIGFMDIHNSIYGYPWFDWWISIIRLMDIHNSILMLMKFADLSQSDCSNWIMWQVNDPCFQRWTTLYQRCALLYQSHATFQVVQRCQTQSNTVQCCCNIAKHYTTLCDVVAKLRNVERCTTLALVIQRCATL